MSGLRMRLCGHECIPVCLSLWARVLLLVNTCSLRALQQLKFKWTNFGSVHVEKIQTISQMQCVKIKCGFLVSGLRKDAIHSHSLESYFNSRGTTFNIIFQYTGLRFSIANVRRTENLGSEFKSRLGGEWLGLLYVHSLFLTCSYIQTTKLSG